MPSTFAHYLFGKTMLGLCPAEVSEAALARRELYDIGLHGPDLLFYYKPLGTNAVNRIGFAMHGRPARDFFVPARRVAAESADPVGARAYLFGFLCHFSLDAACHSYIENKIRLSGVPHTVIESEFDRFLLEREGKDPLTARLTRHIVPSEANARVVAPFFGVTEKQAAKALRSMIFYNDLLRAPHAPKRALVNLVLRFSGNYREMHGMMIAKRPVPACADSDLRLEKLFEKALPQCAQRMREYVAWLDGAGELPAAFDAAFGPAPGWQNIPVLGVEEEKHYEV